MIFEYSYIGVFKDKRLDRLIDTFSKGEFEIIPEEGANDREEICSKIKKRHILNDDTLLKDAIKQVGHEDVEYHHGEIMYEMSLDKYLTPDD